MTTIYFPTNHTPAEWRAKAKTSHQNVQKSWEASDTDGFLTQWAGGVMANVYEACAVLAETDGFTEMAWPMMTEPDTGWIIPVASWRWTQGKYGSSVMVQHPKPYSKPKFWRPSEHKNPQIRLERDRAKGFHWGVVRVQAVITLGGGITPQVITLPKQGEPVEMLQVVAPRYNET